LLGRREPEPAEPAASGHPLEAGRAKPLLQLAGLNGGQHRGAAPTLHPQLGEQHARPWPWLLFDARRDAHSRRDREAAARLAELGGEDQRRATPGLRTHADVLTSRRCESAPSGEGGRNRTVSRPASVSTPTRSRAQPGRASRTAGAAGRPAAMAIAPASAAPSASVNE